MEAEQCVDENKPIEKVEPKVERLRRRSSVGSSLLTAYNSTKSENSIQVAEKMERPRRSVVVRAETERMVKTALAKKRIVKKKVVYSFDFEKTANLRSIMKSQKSKTSSQIAAKKVIAKYRKSTGSTPTNTPNPKQNPKIKFDKICTIRVITPRPEYDSDDIHLPSDDENNKNPDRERLSTVNLIVTPESKIYLNSIKDKNVEKVQFHAEMVFGDGGLESEATSTCAEESSSSETLQNSGLKKKRKRKSLIIGSASPMKPMMPVSSESLDSSETESVSKRKCRRTAKPTKEEEVNDEARRSRRKSGIPSGIGSSVTPMNEQKKDEEKECEIIEEKPTSKPEAVKDKGSRRRSKRFVTEVIDMEPKLVEQKAVVCVPENEKPAVTPIKLFGIFAPKTTPKQKVEPAKSEKVPKPENGEKPKCVAALFMSKPKKKAAEVEEIVVGDSSDEEKNRKPVKSGKDVVKCGIKREKHWGDHLPPTVTYFANTKTQRSVFEESDSIHENQLIFEHRQSTSNSDPLEEHKFSLLHGSEEEFDTIGPNPLEDENETREDVYELEKEAKELRSVGPFEFKPKRMNCLIEGGDEISTVKTWLKKWKKRVRKEAKRESEKEGKGKKKRANSSDDDDDEDFDMSDEDMDLENPLVLIGPNGCGKSAFIHSLAKEGNMKIVGMGPDEERKGLAIKAKMTEAIRSHRIGTSSGSASQGALIRFFQNKPVVYQPKKGKEESTSEAVKKPNVLDKEFAQSLVVFEHVDLLFGSDRNASTALVEIANDAKVPIVWTCEGEYPRADMETRPLEVFLDRRRKNSIRKYCQHLIYHATNIWIDKSIMKKLSAAVEHNLRALILQAYFFALQPERPLPLPTRSGISDGFQYAWNIEQNEETKLEREFEAKEWENIEKSRGKCASLYDILEKTDTFEKQKNIEKSIDSGYKSLYGRFSKRSLKLDVLPILDSMDISQQRKKEQSRRRFQHRFAETTCSNYPIEDIKLQRALAEIRSSHKFVN